MSIKNKVLQTSFNATGYTSFYMGKAILKKTRNGQFRFNLIGLNNEPIATSETYTRKAKAVKTLNVYFQSFILTDKTKKSCL